MILNARHTIARRRRGLILPKRYQHLGVDDGNWPNTSSPPTGHLVNRYGAFGATPNHLRYYRCCCSTGCQLCCYSNESHPNGLTFRERLCYHHFDAGGCTQYDCGATILVMDGWWIEIIVPANVEWRMLESGCCWVTKTTVPIVHKAWSAGTCIGGGSGCAGCPVCDAGLHTNRTGPYYITVRKMCDSSKEPDAGHWQIGYRNQADLCCSFLAEQGSGNPPSIESRCFETDHNCVDDDETEWIGYDDNCCDVSDSVSCCDQVPPPWYSEFFQSLSLSIVDNYCCQCDPGTDCVITSDDTTSCPGDNRATTHCTDDQDDFCL